MSQTYANQTMTDAATGATLTFSNIQVSEVDTLGADGTIENGSVLATLSAPSPYAANPYDDLQWAGFTDLLFGGVASVTLTFSYTVTVSAGADITGIEQNFTNDAQLGNGISTQTVETVTTASGSPVATLTGSQSSNPGSTATLATGYTTLNITDVLTVSVNAPGSFAEIGVSEIDTGFILTAVPATITGTTFTDNADSGVLGSNPVLAGVTVTLLNASGTSVGTAVTNATGGYSFTGLAAGSYTVVFTTPGGDTATTPISDQVTVLAGGTAVENAGFYAPASFTATVYTDANGDSTQDNGETGLAGVTVDLENAGGTVEQTAITNSSGQVTFTGLAPGSYQVAVVAPTGDAVTQQTNVTTVNTLLSGGTANAIEGVYVPASFTATVYNDANDDSTQDNGETGLAGVVVDLENASGTVLQTATTNSTGQVAFTGLAPGSYEIAVVTPIGDTVTQHTNVATVNTLLSGGTANAIEGVYKPVAAPPTATISGEVFLDKNDTGSLTGAPGVAGVTVELENASGTVLATTTTNTSGLYSFTNEAPGTYKVQFIKPSGDTFSPTGGGSASLANQTTGVTPSFTLASGAMQANEDAGLVPASSGITVIKLPAQVVVGTCGQVTYTYDVTNTGSTPLTNVQITDNIGTAANPDYITPTLVTQTGANGVLGVGQTWVYTDTINESGDYSSKGGSVCNTLSGGNLSGGCTAWLNSSFTPTSCKNGATYTFQNVSCTISGPGCPPTTVTVPNACVTFSSSCQQATTTFNSAENCWVTTLPANCSPGNVFLSGLPFSVPSGCNLSGATVTWNIGQSANNCGSSSVSWQTGCTGYSSFNQNGCNGQTDYNQIGVKVCDNSTGYGNGGNINQGYGYNCGDSGGYCGGYWGGGNNWNGSGNDCAGTPENQYTNGNCGSSGYGYGNYGYGGYGDNCGDGSCGNGCGSGSLCQGQLGNSSEADTAIVTATTLGNGFNLGDAANYGIIAFNSYNFQGSSCGPINGNVGVGGNCGIQLCGDRITGNLVTTGWQSWNPWSTGGTVTGCTTTNSSTLATDIAALQALSSTLGSETGTSLALTSGKTINATAGVLDAAGDYVFTITKWANNITINGTGSNNVVFNFASNVTPNLDNVTLTGGLTANEVLFNDQNCGTISGTSGDTFNGTVLAPNAAFSVSGVTVNGHLFGDANDQNFCLLGSTTVNTPANTGSGTPTVTTVTATDSAEVQVLACNSPITENGSTPTGSLTSLYGAADKLELLYSPSNTVKLTTANIGSATGSNIDTTAFIEITNNSNPFASGASVYFEGEVTSGEKIFADATINQLTNTPVAAPNNVFSTVAGADIYAYVFNSQSDFLNQATPVQTIAYNASGSQAMHFGDQIGSLTVIGYVGTNGGHLVS